jgi:hypothetical protein
MRNILFLVIMVLMTSCNEGGDQPRKKDMASRVTAENGTLLIASDIVTDVIIKPAADGDPWEIEKVAGYKGEAMVNAVFDRIYNGSLTAYDYHTGEPLSARDVKEIEKEFNNDRSKIGKLSFTEDWYYDPANNTIAKVTKSVVLGYELCNNEGRVYGYKAAFKAELGK